MASETIKAPLILDPPDNPGIEKNRLLSHDIAQENGDSIPAKPTEKKISTTELDSSEDAAPSDKASTSVNGTTALDIGAGQPSIGDKREHEATPSTADANRPNTEEPGEPVSKKQKTSEEAANATNGTLAPTTGKRGKLGQPANGEKKKGGRPKKSKETAKKNIPADGIGSRTRSRTKPVS